MFVKLLEDTTREPLPHSMRSLLQAMDVKEKPARQRDRPIMSHVWKCMSCGDVTANPQPTFWPAPCGVCGGIFFQAVRDGSRA
jgi:hypothetical protein